MHSTAGVHSDRTTVFKIKFFSSHSLKSLCGRMMISLPILLNCLEYRERISLPVMLKVLWVRPIRKLQKVSKFAHYSIVTQQKRRVLINLMPVEHYAKYLVRLKET